MSCPSSCPTAPLPLVPIKKAMTSSSSPAPNRLLLVAAFLSIYLIWGSTYLAIQVAIESLPSFLMAGVRFVVAGGILFLYAHLVGRVPLPTRENWRAGAVVGGLMLIGGNGCVVWAEHLLPSSLAALLVATVPLWLTVMQWAMTGARPNLGATVGVLGGFAGVALLVGPGKIAGGGQINPIGAGALMIASSCWALGSLQSRRQPLPASPLMSTGVQMLAGGMGLMLASLVSGELAQVDPATFSLRSMGALAYLVVFGSLVGFTSYSWLLQVSTPALVSTYAYINPVVAVFLGWALADEPISPRTLLAAAIIVGAVAIMTTWNSRQTKAGEQKSGEP